MHKLSLTIILATLLAAGGMLLLTSCRQKQPASELFPRGTQSTPVNNVGNADTSTPASEDKGAATAKPANPHAAAANDPKAPLTRPEKVKPGEKSYPPPTKADMDAAKKAGIRHALIKTAKGNIEVELNGTEAPLTVANFVKLAKAGYYNGLTFHRVEPGFVIQGGDQSKDGSGGPGYSIRREVSPNLTHIEGALAMARTPDPNSAGSQFYITLAPTPELDGPPNGPYAVFGKVIAGMNVVKKIAIGDKIISITIFDSSHKH